MNTETTTDRAATAATRAKPPVFQITYATWYHLLAGFSTPSVTPVELDLAVHGRVRALLLPGDATRAA